MTGPTQRTTPAVTADERAAEVLEAEQRLAEAQESGRGRPAWAPLPRRTAPKATSALLSLRTPLSASARWKLAVLSFAIPFLAWVLLSVSGVVNPTFLPSPVAVVRAGVDMASTGELFDDLWATTQRVLEGFGLAILVSVPLGILMGGFSAGQAFFEPLIGLLRYLPASAFIPLLIIWLGIGEPSKIAMLFLGTVFFNTLMTADVVRGVPGALLDVSYTLGARRGEVLRKVVVPHSLPGVIDAIRVNAAAAWNFVVVAELINSSAGLGYRIVRAQRFLQTDKIFAVLVVIGVAGLLIDVLLRLLRTRVGKWAA
ncbi:Urea carboxylase-related ABC transporter [Amycolatopsis camponoti]|uniref:Urea carboxylase-related ABC transporter n=1 Tax=Amycolatopsis camponoti TaxID=2606593 RepID=A0A6I8M2R5_9PSEU|nr:ABC transporter permease [Amycolatopsis camponoti]VVJ23000.1 Urea carboxylase-related ABC transporter [Amycolatopsis camponoti]